MRSIMRLIRSRAGDRERRAQRPGAGATHGSLRIRMAGLCYDTPPVEAPPFPIAMPDKPPRALSEDLYQEKLPSQPLVERFRRKICLLEACIQEKSPLKPLFGYLKAEDNGLVPYRFQGIGGREPTGRN